MGRVKFLKKWREFLEGGMRATLFLKKGNHPHLAEQRADGRKSRAGGRQSRRQSREQEESKKQKAESRADDSKCGMARIDTFIFHWKLFPSNAIARLK